MKFNGVNELMRERGLICAKRLCHAIEQLPESLTGSDGNTYVKIPISLEDVDRLAPIISAELETAVTETIKRMREENPECFL